MPSYATVELFSDAATDFDRPSYGDSMPAYLLPEHHPDYLPPAKAKVRRSGCPGSRPFDWRKGAGRRDSITRLCSRLKHHPQALRWTGEYPEAPPTGQEPQGSQREREATSEAPAHRLRLHCTPTMLVASPQGRPGMAVSRNKVQLSTLISPESSELLKVLKAQKEDELGAPISLAWYVDWLIRQAGKKQGLTGERAAKPAKRSAR